MIATALPVVTEQYAKAQTVGLVPVESDNMEPTLRSGLDYAVVAPVNRYAGEGIYLVNLPLGPMLYRCSSIGPGSIRMTSDNKLYPTVHEVSRKWFVANVRGKVAAEMRVTDPRALRAAA